MDSLQLSSLVSDAISKELQWTWVYWVLLTVLTTIAGALGAYFGAYFRRRGEQSAIQSKFNEILEQLKATTELTEGIKSDIANQDWLQRESNSVRRKKLEEILTLTAEYGALISRVILDAYVTDRELEVDFVEEKDALLTSRVHLYFPSLVQAAGIYTACGDVLVQKSLVFHHEVRTKERTNSLTSEEYGRLAGEYQASVSHLRSRFFESKNELFLEGVAAMRLLLSVADHRPVVR